MHKVGDTTPLEGFTGYFGEQYRYTYKTGNYSPEKYMNDKYGTNYAVETTVEGNYHYYPYDIAGTSTENPTLYNLLFEGTEASDNFARSYWLASHGVRAYSSYAYFGPGYVANGDVYSYYYLFYSDGYWYAFRYAVRPVVSLRSEVSLSEVGGKGTAGTDIWSSVSVESGLITVRNFDSEGETAGKIQ